jgi:ubiquinone/menaquinone biosynthesis C-methylase UbiE
MKEKLYNLIAHSGIWFMQKFFPEYFAIEPLRPTDRYIEYPWVLHHLPKDQKLEILDVGCSGSMFPLIMKSLGHNVSGVDIRPCKSNINFFQYDICLIFWEDNRFDIITAISTIEHIGLKGRYGVNEESTDFKAIQTIYRILKPGGMFYMTVPFGNKSDTKTHRIYDHARLQILMGKFTYYVQFEQSPEANYEIALVRGVK